MLIRGYTANSAFGYSGCREKLLGKPLMQQEVSKNSLQMQIADGLRGLRMATLFCPRLQCSMPPEP